MLFRSIISKIVDRITPFIDRLLKMSDAQIFGAMKTMGLVAALGPLLSILGSVVVKAGALVTMIGKAGGLSAVLAVATGPIGWVVGGIAALAAITALCWKEIKPMRDAIAFGLTPALRDLQGTTEGSGGALSAILGTLRTYVGMLASYWAPFAKLGLYIGMLPLRWLIFMFTLVTNVIRGVFNALSLVIGAIQWAWTWFTKTTVVGQFLSSVFDMIGLAAKTVSDFIGGLVENFKGLFSTAADFLGKLGIDMAASKDQIGRASCRERV